MNLDKVRTRPFLLLMIKAGVDIFCFGNNLHYDQNLLSKVFSILIELYKEEQISEDQIHTSYKRIMSLKKSIGIWRSWALVAGMMIGSGIFTLPALLASYGSFSFIGWAVTGFGALCLALSYSYLSGRQSGLGGPYFFVQQAFGKIPAAIVGWGYWISLVSSIAAIALSFLGYSQNFLPILASEPLYSTIFSIFVILFFTGINLWGVREASTVQLITTIIKILPLLMIGLLGIMFGEVTDIPAVNPDDSLLAKESLVL